VSALIVADRCRNCAWELAPGDLFCAYCGVEAPSVTAPSAAPPTGVSRLYRAECQGCGASMRFDAAQQALACPFCGATRLAEAPASEGRAVPETYVPFAIDRADVQTRFTTFARSSFWHPGDLSSQATFENIRRVYVPAWRFAGDLRTFWTADTTREARHSWRPIAGSRQTSFADMVILASQALTPTELTALAPFPLEVAQPFTDDGLAGDEVIEAPVLSQAAALRTLPGQLEAREEAAVKAELPGDIRQVHCDQLITGVQGQLALLPVWIVAYRYRDKPYRFLANGQTGASTGTAPVSTGKVVVVVVAAILVILALLALAAVAAQTQMSG
jgi:hypothetical protein